MKTLTAVLAVFKIKRSMHRWGIHKELEKYPSFELSRSTIYRTADRALAHRLLQHEGTDPGRNKDKQMLSLTAAGDQQAVKLLLDTEVGVYNMRRPQMHLYQFIDFLALVKEAAPALVDRAIKRRARSIQVALDKGLEKSDILGMDILERGLILQYHTELTRLEDIQTLTRQPDQMDIIECSKDMANTWDERSDENG